MLTARERSSSEYAASKRAADDYVVKPSEQELLARVQALLRRAGREASQQQEHYMDDHLTIDFGSAASSSTGERSRSRRLESRLLGPSCATTPGTVLRTTAELVWGDAYGLSEVTR